jgi:hypothetical protein
MYLEYAFSSDQIMNNGQRKRETILGVPNGTALGSMSLLNVIGLGLIKSEYEKNTTPCCIFYIHFSFVT